MLSLEEVFSPTRRVLKEFAGILALFCGGIGTWQMLASGPLWGKVLCAVGFTIGILGLIRSDAIKPLWVAWTLLAYPIAWLVSHLILTVIFFGVITPIGLLLRLFRGDVLQLKIDRECESYWEPKPQPTSVKSYFRQF